MEASKMIFLCKWVIFRFQFHVNFPGRFSNTNNCDSWSSTLILSTRSPNEILTIPCPCFWNLSLSQLVFLAHVTHVSFIVPNTKLPNSKSPTKPKTVCLSTVTKSKYFAEVYSKVTLNLKQYFKWTRLFTTKRCWFCVFVGPVVSSWHFRKHTHLNLYNEDFLLLREGA